eukprot:gene12962-15325_t
MFEETDRSRLQQHGPMWMGGEGGAASRKDASTSEDPVEHAETQLSSPLFEHARMKSVMQHANEITTAYGVCILRINIISARATDQKLTAELSKGAMATAEARLAEAAAVGSANAARIEARGLADVEIIRSKAAADADVIRAKGRAEAEKISATAARAAADMLKSNNVAVELVKIEKTGIALGAHAKFFFGVNPGAVGSLIANPGVVNCSQSSSAI